MCVCPNRCLQDLNVSYNRLSRLRVFAELLPHLQVLDISENALEGSDELVSTTGSL